MNTEPQDPSDTLSRELSALRQEISRLNGHRFVRIHASLWRLAGFQFLRGLAFGLGTVVGATILVSLLAYLLSTVDFIPIVGDWAAQIAREIESGTK